MDTRTDDRNIKKDAIHTHIRESTQTHRGRQGPEQYARGWASWRTKIQIQNIWKETLKPRERQRESSPRTADAPAQESKKEDKEEKEEGKEISKNKIINLIESTDMSSKSSLEPNGATGFQIIQTLNLAGSFIACDLLH